jgi:hypothetical protein
MMDNFDYNTVSPWPDDEPGFCLLEWDIALDVRDRDRFAVLAAENPGVPLVAPYYKLYGADPPVCMHRVKYRGRWYPSHDGVLTTDLFGFGCIYLPLERVREFQRHQVSNERRRVRPDDMAKALGLPPGSFPGRRKFTDSSFSVWHFTEYGPIGVAWNVHPQHLHGD